MKDRIIEILKQIKELEEKKTDTTQQIEKLKEEYNRIVEEIQKNFDF
jgi:regulator of replication initiation timing